MIPKTELKLEYIRMVNDHHREMELLRKRNELAHQYSERIYKASMRYELIWMFLCLALCFLIGGMVFRGLFI